MVTYNSTNGYFYVDEGNVKAAGTHTISLQISYINVINPIFNNKKYDFTLEMVSNSFAISNKAPQFQPEISKQSFIAGQISQYKLGEIVDDENDSVQMSIKYDACQKFVTFDDVQNIFTINPVLKDKGTYNIVITLKDDNFDSKTNQILFQFDVTFSNFSVSIGEENLTKEEKELKAKTFTSFTSYKILKISNLGIITILFEDQLKVPANYQTKLNRSLDIKLIQSDSNVLNLNYSIKEMTSSQMSIQLDTVQVSNISQTNEWDKVQVSILENYFFVSSDASKIMPLKLTFQKKIPPQLSQCKFDKFKNDLATLNMLNSMSSASTISVQTMMGGVKVYLIYGE
eukprot:403353364